jgi:hypothetical protein
MQGSNRLATLILLGALPLAGSVFAQTCGGMSGSGAMGGGR